MKLVYRGVSYEYNPPQVSYPDSSTANAIKDEARALFLAERQRVENRQQSMLMRSMHELGVDASGSSEGLAYS